MPCAFFLFLFVPYFSLNAAMLAAVVPRSALHFLDAFVLVLVLVLVRLVLVVVIALGLRGDALAEGVLLVLVRAVLLVERRDAGSGRAALCLACLLGLRLRGRLRILSFPAGGAANAADAARTSESRAAIVSSLFMAVSG